MATPPDLTVNSVIRDVSKLLGIGRLRVDDRIEGNWKGYGTWYPGKIVSIEGNKYNILYDDGDTETITDLTRLIKEGSKDRRCSNPLSSTFETGTSVLARWRGKALWYPATVTSFTDKGRYVVRYNDDEEETLMASQVKLPSSTASDSKVLNVVRRLVAPAYNLIEPRLKVGERVSGNWKGYGTWYQGHVLSVSLDSWERPFPLVVKYDDDDEETFQIDDMHRIKRTLASKRNLGYETLPVRPSVYGQREGFGSEATHVYKLGERVVIVGVPIVFTVEQRLNHMIRIVADVSAVTDPAEREKQMRELFFPEQTCWLVKEDDLAISVEDMDITLTPYDAIDTSSVEDRQKSYDEIVKLTGLDPSEDSKPPRALSASDLVRLKSRLAEIKDAEEQRLQSSFEVLRATDGYTDDDRKEAKERIEEEGRLIRKALDPAINLRSRRSILHCVDEDESNYMRIAEIVLDAGASANVYDFMGMTPLYTACARGNVAIADFLISRGANALLPGPGLVTPVHMMLSPKFNVPMRLVVPAMRSRRWKTNKFVKYDFDWLDHFDLPSAPTSPLFRIRDIAKATSANASMRQLVNDMGDERTGRRHATVDSVLTIVVRDAHLKALGTPVVQQLLDHKWSVFASRKANLDALAALALALALLPTRACTPRARASWAATARWCSRR